MKINCSYTKVVDIDSLVPNPRNANEHPQAQIKLLAKIMKHQGWRSPIVVSNRSGFMVKGHGRLEAAKINGWTEAPVDFQDYANEADEWSDMIADNKIAELALSNEMRIQEIALDLGPDFDFDLFGIPDFKISGVDTLPPGDEDHIPEHVEPRTKLGDIYKLGRHRLMCGDSTSIDSVTTLLGDVSPDLIHSDPPYGMNAVSKSGVLSKTYKTDILGDDNPDVAKDCFRLIYGMFPDSKHVWWGANYYSSALPDAECWIVWDKNNGQSDQTDAELAWSNFRSVVRKWTKSSEKTNRVHPTQKPVELTEFVIDRFDVHPKTIADFFGGSGSTMIAAEKIGSSSYLMEFDPRFCDIIVARWEKYTGLKAELISGNSEKAAIG